ncbi:hypothetical protein BJ508DRAFT_381451 [Ascobolus immersus RN42]|uniref:Uncharacterized protein n=1 Tax=Ascobolus immersus RN42 TaxID=1160509 RepID=A0A3N4HJ55_ASCIM|nr:hypothetical protein BJ508DRAFT_381451 [Ascobolus immersus RN42]
MSETMDVSSQKARGNRSMQKRQTPTGYFNNICTLAFYECAENRLQWYRCEYTDYLLIPPASPKNACGVVCDGKWRFEQFKAYLQTCTEMRHKCNDVVLFRKEQKSFVDLVSGSCHNAGYKISSDKEEYPNLHTYYYTDHRFFYEIDGEEALRKHKASKKKTVFFEKGESTFNITIDYGPSPTPSSSTSSTSSTSSSKTTSSTATETFDPGNQNGGAFNGLTRSPYNITADLNRLGASIRKQKTLEIQLSKEAEMSKSSFIVPVTTIIANSTSNFTTYATVMPTLPPASITDTIKPGLGDSGAEQIHSKPARLSIALGVVLGVVVLVALFVVFMFWRLRKRHEEVVREHTVELDGAGCEKAKPKQELAGGAVCEADELNEPTQELEGDNVGEFAGDTLVEMHTEPPAAWELEAGSRRGSGRASGLVVYVG